MSEDLRSRILDAAIKLLEREGVSALRQTRVAKEAGVEQGHLTYYFPRRADLVHGIFDRAGERAREGMMKAIARGTTDGMQSLFFQLARSMAKDVKRTRLLLGLIVESQVDAELTKPIAEMFRMQRQAVAMILGRAQDDVEVELAIAALRGIGLEQMVLGADAARVDALVGRLEAWVSSGRAETVEGGKTKD